MQCEMCTGWLFVLDTDAILHRCVCPPTVLLYQPDGSFGRNCGIDVTVKLFMLVGSRLEVLLIGPDTEETSGSLWMTVLVGVDTLSSCREVEHPTTQIMLE